MVNRRNASLALVAALMMLVWSAPQVLAQAKADATGTWKWQQAGFGGGRGGGRRGGGAPGGAPASQPGGGAAAAPGGGGAPPGGGGGRGGGAPIEITATLKQDGDKLTGSVMGMTPQDPTAKADIKEGSVKADGTVAFKVTTTGGRGEITRVFSGKLDGDTIKGSMAFDFGGAAPGGGAPGGGAPRGGGAPGGGGAAPGGGAPGGGAPGGGGGRGGGGPQDWTATRSK